MKSKVDIPSWYQFSKLNQDLNFWFKSKIILLIFFYKLFSHFPQCFYSYEIITIPMNGCKFRHIYCIYSFRSQAKVISYLSVADPGISEPGGAVEFFGSGDCFMHLHKYPVCFVVRSSRAYDTNCTHCMLTTIKVYASYAFKIQKNNPPPNKIK